MAFGQAKGFCGAIQLLAPVNHVDVAAQIVEIPRGVQPQVGADADPKVLPVRSVSGEPRGSGPSAPIQARCRASKVPRRAQMAVREADKARTVDLERCCRTESQQFAVLFRLRRRRR